MPTQGKQVNISGGVVGNVVSIDPDGNLEDSGSTPSSTPDSIKSIIVKGGVEVGCVLKTDGNGALADSTANAVGVGVTESTSGTSNTTVTSGKIVLSVDGGVSAPAGTELILHGDGTDGATTTTDSSSNAFTMTSVGSFELDTAVKKFGTASMLFDGVDSGLTAPTDPAYEFSTGDFRAETWVNVSNTSGSLYDTLVGYVSGTGGGWADIGWVLLLNAAGTVTFQASDNGGTGIVLTSSTDISAAGWTHVMASRVSGTTRLFIDGVIEDSTATVWTAQDTSWTLKLGHGYATTNFYDGHLDEVLVAKGIGVSAGFTPNTLPYSTDGEGVWPESAGADDVLYLSESTAGLLTKTAPTGTGERRLRVVQCTSTTEGFVLAPESLDANPSGGVGGAGSTTRGHIAGLQGTTGADALHDIDFSAGSCRSGDDSTDLSSAGEIKQIDANWATGTNAGGFPSGLTLTADTWYHRFIVDKTDGTFSFGWDSSLTATNLLADTGGTKYRRIGSDLTDGSSNIIPTTQNGDDFYWDSPPKDVETTLSTSAVLTTLSVPLGVSVISMCNYQFRNDGDEGYVYVSNPAVDDEAPSNGSTPPFGTFKNDVARSDSSKDYVRTNTSSQVRARASVSMELWKIATLGWADTRGRDD